MTRVQLVAQVQSELPTLDLVPGEFAEVRRERRQLDPLERHKNIRVCHIADGVDLPLDCDGRIAIDAPGEVDVRAGQLLRGESGDRSLELLDPRAEARAQRQIGKNHGTVPDAYPADRRQGPARGIRRPSCSGRVCSPEVLQVQRPVPADDDPGVGARAGDFCDLERRRERAIVHASHLETIPPEEVFVKDRVADPPAIGGESAPEADVRFACSGRIGKFPAETVCPGEDLGAAVPLHIRLECAERRTRNFHIEIEPARLETERAVRPQASCTVEHRARREPSRTGCTVPQVAELEVDAGHAHRRFGLERLVREVEREIFCCELPDQDLRAAAGTVAGAHNRREDLLERYGPVSQVPCAQGSPPHADLVDRERVARLVQ